MLSYWGEVKELEDILQKISSAAPSEINSMTHALLMRYSDLFPDWEIAFLSIPKGDKPNKQLSEIIEFLVSLRDGS